MRQAIGFDLGSGAIKIAIVKNNKLYSTHSIEVGARDPKFVLHDLKQFMKKNKLPMKDINLLIKDYKTKSIKMEKISRKELESALLYEREEKIGTTEILGDNYRDNHIIQKKTNNSLEILLTVINEQEINKQEAFLEMVGITKGTFIMECFLYNDLMPDNSVIVDIGYNSIEIMFYDRKKVVKTGLLKKGVGDIIGSLKEKVDPSSSYADIQQFSFENTAAPAYETVISWLNLYADNIINTINAFVKENSKSLSGLSIYYTGGIFTNSRMVEYFNYQMGVEGTILRAHENQDPLFNNSIALAFRAGMMGVVSGGSSEAIEYTNIAFSYALTGIFSLLLFVGGFDTYQYFNINRQAEKINETYKTLKSDFDPLHANYQELNTMLGGADTAGTADNLNKVMNQIKDVLNSGITITKVSLQNEKTIEIEGKTVNYTNLGVFGEEIKNQFGNIAVKELYVDENENTRFRLECTF